MCTFGIARKETGGLCFCTSPTCRCEIRSGMGAYHAYSCPVASQVPRRRRLSRSAASQSVRHILALTARLFPWTRHSWGCLREDEARAMSDGLGTHYYSAHLTAVSVRHAKCCARCFLLPLSLTHCVDRVAQTCRSWCRWKTSRRMHECWTSATMTGAAYIETSFSSRPRRSPLRVDALLFQNHEVRNLWLGGHRDCQRGWRMTHLLAASAS